MTKSATLLVTGLIRLPERFTRTLEQAKSLMAEGVLSKAVFSTWHGEIEKYPGMRQALNEAGFRIVEAPEPERESIGNIWRQMIAYAAGLTQITTPYVLKTRPDVFINEWVIRRLVSEIPRKPFVDLPATPFHERVWAPWMVISRPFYLADECHFSTLQDAWLLHNIDMNYDKWGVDGGISHMRRYIHPFRDHKEVRVLSERYPMIGPGCQYKKMGERLNDPEYIRLLSWYYAIIRRCFDIYTGAGDIEFRPWSIRVERPGPHVISLEDQYASGRIDKHCHDDAYIDAIAAGVYDHEPIGRALSAGIRGFEAAVVPQGSSKREAA
jgi:hypothetical protein